MKSTKRLACLTRANVQDWFSDGGLLSWGAGQDYAGQGGLFLISGPAVGDPP
jgi:hypothetical protein